MIIYITLIALIIIRFSKPQLSIALAAIPIFSGNWGLTKIIEGLIIFTIMNLNHEIT